MRLAAPTMTHPGHPLFRRRAGGVLLHPTSLPGGQGIGDLGPPARRFVDWLETAGLGLWQMLPIGPVGKGNSPYSGRSAFAGEPLLISLEDLVADGLLERNALRGDPPRRLDRVSYAAVRRFKLPRLREACETFRSRGGTRGRDFRNFRMRNRGWLVGWCDYAAEPDDDAAIIQFFFDRQWRALRHYAHRRRVMLVGDLPIFIELDSADVAQRPDLFLLDADGRPRARTGAAPDAFSASGQLWGHPQYDWAAHRRDRWSWWTLRFRQALARYDAVRLDHFLGFVRLWHVPPKARTARNGRWRPTPGRALLEVLHRRLGPLPVIAEDLGVMTPAVTKLRQDFRFPGMRILQWAFGEPDGPDLPHRYPRDAVVYPGTHDNETAAGWYRSLRGDARKRFEAYAGPGSDPAEALVRLAFTSPAVWAVAQAQDLLGLDPSTRMNRPGVPEGNWTWRLTPGTLSRRRAGLLYRLSETSGRLPGADS